MPAGDLSTVICVKGIFISWDFTTGVLCTDDQFARILYIETSSVETFISRDSNLWDFVYRAYPQGLHLSARIPPPGTIPTVILSAGRFLFSGILSATKLCGILSDGVLSAGIVFSGIFTTRNLSAGILSIGILPYPCLTNTEYRGNGKHHTKPAMSYPWAGVSPVASTCTG